MEKTRESVHMCSVKGEVGGVQHFGIKRIKAGSMFDQKTIRRGGGGGMQVDQKTIRGGGGGGGSGHLIVI